MQRKTLILLRAVRILRREAREYVEDAKNETDEDLRRMYGRRAKSMYGTAMAVEQMALMGAIITRKIERKSQDQQFYKTLATIR